MPDSNSTTEVETKVAHTPGEWTATRGRCVGQLQSWWDVSVPRGSESYTYPVNLAMVFHCDGLAEANARLMAASPRLLTALENLERAIDGFSRGEDYYVRDHGLALMLARKEARGAVAQARGEVTHAS